MNTPKNIIIGLLLALVFIQHALSTLAFSKISIPDPNVFLVLNTIEVIVLFTAGKMLFSANKLGAVIVVGIAVVVMVATILENFSSTLGEQIWIFVSSLIVFDLALSAAFLAKK